MHAPPNSTGHNGPFILLAKDQNTQLVRDPTGDLWLLDHRLMTTRNLTNAQALALAGDPRMELMHKSFTTWNGMAIWTARTRAQAS